MKGVAENAWLTAETEQVSDYWGAYRLIIVTNLRDFLILGEDEIGRPARLETFHLAKDVATFWRLAEMPESAAKEIGRAFGEYLKRALTQSVALREPKDVAWFWGISARVNRTLGFTRRNSCRGASLEEGRSRNAALSK